MSTSRAQLGILEKLSEAFASLAGGCFDHRWLVSGVCLALFAGSIALGTRIEQDASYEAYFDEGDTTYQAYEDYREDFGSDEIAYVGFELPGLEHGPWHIDAMGALVELTRALEDEVPFVYSVTSLANAELTVGTADGIEITRIRDAMPLTQAALIAGFSIFLFVAGMGASRVVVDSNSLNDFWEDTPIRRATVRVDDEMGGVANVVYLFDGGRANAIKDPAVLREIERLENLANEERGLVRKTYSIVDIVKDLNQAFHDSQEL